MMLNLHQIQNQDLIKRFSVYEPQAVQSLGLEWDTNINIPS